MALEASWGSIEKASDNDDSYVLDCYNMGEINGQQKATGTLGSDYRGGIVGNLGSHGRCYRAVNGGYVRFGNAGVGNGNKKNLTHIYILPGTGKRLWSNVYPPNQPEKIKISTKDSTSREIMIQTGNLSGFWVAHIARRIKCYPTCIQGKCYFQFIKYAP